MVSPASSYHQPPVEPVMGVSPQEAPVITGVILLSLSTLFYVVSLATPLVNGESVPFQSSLFTTTDFEFRAFELCVRTPTEDDCEAWADVDETCCGMEATYRTVAALLVVSMVLSFAAWCLAVYVLHKTVNRPQPERRVLREDAVVDDNVRKAGNRRGLLSKIAGLLSALATVLTIAAVGTLFDSDAYDASQWAAEWALVPDGDVTRRAGIGSVLAVITIFVTFAAVPFLALFEFGCEPCYFKARRKRQTAIVSPAAPEVGEAKASEHDGV